MNLLDTINNAVLSGTRALFSEATYTPASGDDPFTVHVILERSEERPCRERV
mgnify:CR=1 FL=1